MPEVGVAGAAGGAEDDEDVTALLPLLLAAAPEVDDGCEPGVGVDPVLVILAVGSRGLGSTVLRSKATGRIPGRGHQAEDIVFLFLCLIF